MGEAQHRAILLADVSESSELFNKLGDAEAVALVGPCIDRMIAIAEAHEGVFVHSRGDDVLCIFEDATAAHTAATEMLAACPKRRVAVHAGLHWGPVILARNEAFGDAVNLAARLASLANSGEGLMTVSLADRLPAEARAELRSMDRMSLKGIAQPVEVFAQLLPTQDRQSGVTYTGHRRESAAASRLTGISVRLSHGEDHHDLVEGTEYLIGRSPECDLVLSDQWISRRHGSVVVRRGLVEYRDRSSTGSYIRVGDGDEYYVHRQTVLLTTSGTIAPGRSADAPLARLIRFSVSRG